MTVSNEPKLILCASARLARSLQSAYSEKQLKLGHHNWQPLNVKTLEPWLDTLLTTALLLGELDFHSAPQRRLTALEERLIWQEVIAAALTQEVLKDLFDLAGLAEACAEANQYVVAWRLQMDIADFSEETRQFLAWRALFQARCKALNVLESVRYFEWQVTCAARGAGLLPPSIAFAGFDHAAPQEQRLRAALRARGCEVQHFQTVQAEVGTAEHIELPDQAHELRSMVAWAKAMLDKKSTVKLALVIPELSVLRNTLADLIDDVFQPVSVRPSLAETARMYNFSLGVSLAQQPVIQAALHLIRLFTSQQLNQADLTGAWLSPYWSASVVEADGRALLDATMREFLPQTTRWSRVFSLMQQKADVGQLFEDCQQGHAYMESQSRRQLPSVWANVFAVLLQKIHWPGERRESSHEYQAKQAWEKALQQLAGLDFLGNSLTASAASALLQQICKEQVFQPETAGDPPIQIMGMMEALSAPVDAMWVMGMNDDIWPPPARPNPLLPASIQRAAGVANADSAVQTAFAQVIHQRLLHSAQTIIFSSSLKSGDKALRVSPLMQTISVSAKLFSIAQTLAESIAAQGNAGINLVEDHIAPKVLEGEHVRGGTGLLRAQAICPAWAFYQFRLGAKNLKTPKNGLDAAERGQLVHGALEQFWVNAGQYRHFEDCLQLNEPAMQQAIAIAVTSAIEDFKQQHEEVFSPEVFMLEHERLCKLLAGWLAYEKLRAVPFKMVACEVEKKVDILGIEVTLKIDRIHQLEDGGIEFVDYKTGQLPKIKSWGEQRMTEPQLPIYAVFYSDTPDAVVGIQFGLVKTAEHGFSGVAEMNFDEEREKRKPEFIRTFDDWSALQAHWKIRIEAIVLELKAGEAAVVFENESDLQYCEVRALLRLPERQLQFEHHGQAAISVVDMTNAD
jgi:probable DNA repair protein